MLQCACCQCVDKSQVWQAKNYWGTLGSSRSILSRLRLLPQMRLSVIEHAKPCEERRCASKWILYTQIFSSQALSGPMHVRPLEGLQKWVPVDMNMEAPQKPTLEIKCKRNIEWNPWHHQIEIQLNLQNLSLLNHKIFKMAMSSMSSGSGYLFRITRTSWSYWNIPEIYQSFRCSHTNRNVKPVNDSNYFQFF